MGHADRVLFYGDNLEVLRLHIADESIDLVYLDPPFKSGKDYNLIFRSKNGYRAAAQVEAFEDTWEWGPEAERAYADALGSGGDTATALAGMRNFLGTSDLMAYLCMMAPRLQQLRRVIKPTGTIYLHCDPTASHYLKVLMDAVFGSAGFRNEVVWRYRRMPAKSRDFQRVHDVLLRYAKDPSAGTVFNVLYDELAPSTLKTWGTKKQNAVYDSSGHRLKSSTLDQESPGVPMGDVWDIGIIAPVSKERLGYPTQKPEALLERVILASSNQDDIVLDPFCGCGTAVAVAQKLRRRWVGIDITHLAVNLVRHRLACAFGPDLDFRVIGEPKTLEDATALAQHDRFQFQFWALGLVGARPAERDQKRGADKGIDGRLFFQDSPGGKTSQIVFSVKSGHVKAGDVRDLRGVVDRESAAIGVLITLAQPSRPMVKEALSAGFYQALGRRFPRLQVLTVDELLHGRKVDYPARSTSNVTYRPAPIVKAGGKQQQLPFGASGVAKAKPTKQPTRKKRRTGA